MLAETIAAVIAIYSAINHGASNIHMYTDNMGTRAFFGKIHFSENVFCQLSQNCKNTVFITNEHIYIEHTSKNFTSRDVHEIDFL